MRGYLNLEPAAAQLCRLADAPPSVHRRQCLGCGAGGAQAGEGARATSEPHRIEIGETDAGIGQQGLDQGDQRGGRLGAPGPERSCTRPSASSAAESRSVLVSNARSRGKGTDIHKLSDGRAAPGLAALSRLADRPFSSASRDPRPLLSRLVSTLLLALACPAPRRRMPRRRPVRACHPRSRRPCSALT